MLGVAEHGAHTFDHSPHELLQEIAAFFGIVFAADQPQRIESESILLYCSYPMSFIGTQVGTTNAGIGAAYLLAMLNPELLVALRLE